MTLKEIREEHDRKVFFDDEALTFQEMVIKSIELVEIHKFKRKGKLDYSFSNETVKI
ncbi:hypothetical protein [Photobacterium rosenbergii]|uniref:hypothetical protein n=1 Tax=Photobacterium rosenbergii TaxID=294936 RepID=UPI001C99DA7F|nr:hypothetical protein [Photobacterium rosenbergii]MBY5944933.1 hypothetical protein [Photobacterium rosenbergii]